MSRSNSTTPIADALFQPERYDIENSPPSFGASIVEESGCLTCPITSKEQQDAVIDATIKAAYLDPQAPTSLRAIASMLPQWLKADHKRVGRRLDMLLSTGAVPQLIRTCGADGKFRLAKRIPHAEIDDDFWPKIEFICGEAFSELRRLPSDSVHCCVTSPPYFQQMDICDENQIGQEATVEDYISNLVKVFSQVRRVIHQNGTCWINIADTFRQGQAQLVPQRLALALQSHGWTVRAEIIVEKNNPAPFRHEGRPTPTHETLLMLALNARHYFDVEALRENSGCQNWGVLRTSSQLCGTVWRVPTVRHFVGQHPAPMAKELARDCVTAGSPPGGTVIDPFAGVGTTLVASAENYRHAIGIEISPYYISLAKQRFRNVTVI